MPNPGLKSNSRRPRNRVAPPLSAGQLRWHPVHVIGQADESQHLPASGERLIEREEPFAAEQVADALREGGVDVRLETSVTSVARNGAVRAELDRGEPVEADELLVAIGRTGRPRGPRGCPRRSNR